MNAPAFPEEGGGRLGLNVLHFCRALRAAGMPIGTGRALGAVRAVRRCGIDDRETFYWALHAALVSRPDQREIFGQMFHVFWRNPHLLERMMQLVLPRFRTGGDRDGERTPGRRIVDAMSPGEGEPAHQPGDEVELDAALTWSATEVLRSMDFETMSAAEMAIARAAISRMHLVVAEKPTRRFRPGPHGSRIDFRASFRAAHRAGDTIVLRRREARTRPPPLVVLCDISGSMGRYSRMLLHFTHTLSRQRDRTHTFLFGTRLTNITRHLRYRDVDEALDRAGKAAEDWSGGTRIGLCLRSFNQDWSRRVLGQGAIVLLISDGLDRDAGQGLSEEIERLRRSCRRLIWLNPLLRYEQFAPRSRGIRAILPHVDEFRPVHSLDSLEDLARALDAPVSVRGSTMSAWREKLAALGESGDSERETWPQ